MSEEINTKEQAKIIAQKLYATLGPEQKDSLEKIYNSIIEKSGYPDLKKVENYEEIKPHITNENIDFLSTLETSILSLKNELYPEAPIKQKLEDRTLIKNKTILTEADNIKNKMLQEMKGISAVSRNVSRSPKNTTIER